MKRVLLLAVLALWRHTSLAQPVVMAAGTSTNFVAPAGAAGYVWALDGGATTNTGSVFSYSPAVNSVGTHWLSVAMTQTNGGPSSQNWQFRVDIVLPASGTNYYVATTGSDTNGGTLAAPFLTLERARNAIRSTGVPAGGVTVWIGGGTYQRTNTFALTSLDSGDGGSPVVYCAYPGETPVFTTGTAINSNSFTTLDTNLWSRVMPGVTASNILQLDLNALGTVHKGPFPTHFGQAAIYNGYNPGFCGGLCELFYNGQRQLISRYPNNNPANPWLTPYMKVNGVVFNTATNYMGTNIGGMFHFSTNDAAHVDRWLAAAAETNLWVQGYWRVPWEIDGVRVGMIDTVSNSLIMASGATPGGTGFGDKYSGPAGSYNEPYWALNLLEEIDQPGEWSIDFVRNKLYFLPPGPVTNGAVILSDFGSPMFQVTGGSNVVFSGLTFNLSLAQGILITNGVNNLILGCTFSNLGNYGVDLSGGQTNGVVSCNLSQLAAGGINLSGGSETNSPRIPTENFVVNNDICNFAQVVRIYTAAVDAGFGGESTGGGGGGHVVCVGARVAHNHIAGTPHAAVLRGSFDKVFEYNDIEGYCAISGDFGGIYSYQSTNQGGYDLLRFNYLSCPTNYLYPTYLNPGPAGGIGIQVDGSWVGEQMYGNLTANDVRGSYGEGGEGGAGAEFYDNMQVNCGPTIPMEWEGTPAVFATNVAALGNLTISGDQTGPNYSYATDPGFINWTNQDFRLNPASVVYTGQTGFQEIPVEMIGLYNDEFRTNAVALPPVISNVTGVTALATNSATLNGELIFPWLTPDTTVTVFWGPNDGGTNSLSWANALNLGLQTRATLSTNVTGLLPKTTYFYRFQASNSAAVVWATNSVSFIVPDPGYQATISFPGYTRSEVLTNIPLLVTLGTNIPGFSYANFASPAGGDLRFKTADGLTDLNFEIESWNTNGSSFVWVQVPALTDATSLLAQWGDTLNTNLPASSTDGSTWSNGYAGVWHFNSTAATDSSPAPQNASASSGILSSGIVAGGLNYNGVSQTTTIPQNNKFNLAADFAIEGWFMMNASSLPPAGAYGALTSKEAGATNQNWWIAVCPNGTISWHSSPNPGVTNSSSLANNQWHQFSAVYGGSTAQLYVDGVPAAAAPVSGPAATPAAPVYFASETGSTNFFNGSLDEFRFSNVSRSSNWVWAVYQNIASNSVFDGYSAITNLLPTAPASLTASSANGEVILNWSASVGATSYNVQQSTTNGGPYAVITNVTGLAFTNTGLVIGTTYYYTVSGVNSRGVGDASPQASAIPLGSSVKANNTLSLDQPGSWLNDSVPTNALAIWDTNVTSAGTVSIGGGVSFAGLEILNPGMAIVINPGTNGTLALGVAGVDLSASSQTLTLNSGVTLGASQDWKTGSYGAPGSLQIVAGGALIGPGALALDAANTRAVSFNSSQTVTGAIITANSNLISFAAATNFFVGQSITGANIPGGTYLETITGTNVILSANATTNANPTGTVVIGNNLFAGGFTLNPGSIASYAGAPPPVALGGALICSPLGTGPLTINGGTLTAGNTSPFYNPAINVLGNFTWSTTFRDDVSGLFNLGGATRTLTLTCAVTPANVVVGGGNNSIRFNPAAVTGGLTANIFTNGTLQIAAASAVPATDFVNVTFGTASGNIFAANAGLILGPQVYGNQSLSAYSFGTTPAYYPALTLQAGAYWSLCDATAVRSTSIASLSGAGTVLNNGAATSGTGTLTIDGGTNTTATTFSGVIKNTELATFPTATAGLITALTKQGATTQILSGTNTYTGATTINAGTLIINGNQSAATGPVTVASGATLGGTGVIGGTVSVSNGATLWPGNSPGTLNLRSNLNLAGAVILAVARNGVALTNDQIVVMRTNTYGGTLVVTNLGATPLQVGDTFQLFSAGDYAGAFTNFVYPAGYTFTNTLTNNGSIMVLTGRPNTPPVLAPISDVYLNPGQWLDVTNSASDAQAPPQILTFSLPAAPAGAAINPVTGILSWRVPVALEGTVQPFTVEVSNNGSPSLSATQTFNVFIGSVAVPVLTQTLWSNGVFSSLINGDVGPDYIVQASTNLIVWDGLFTNTPTVLPFQWADLTTTNFSSRFYRVLLGP